ncbi:MAG: hemerythrin family protein [Alphaproteobacteria bacterium]|nr:hemerythrin family protein [Alphaproteobacteria bacterium]
MAYFTWQDKFDTGIEAVDHDHHILADLVSQLHDAFASGKGEASIGPVLAVLVDYSDYHFKREEALMFGHGYPGAEAHKAEHDSLKAKVLDIRHRFEAGEGSAIGNELLAFLHFWLYFHILDVDMAFKGFFIEKGVAKPHPSPPS